MYVYVMADGHGRSKIGISSAPSRRRKQVAGGNSSDVHICEVYRTTAEEARRAERAAHAVLKHLRTRGEWFDCCPTLAKAAVRHALTGAPTQEQMGLLFRHREIIGGPPDKDHEEWIAISERIKAEGFVDMAELDPWY